MLGFVRSIRGVVALAISLATLVLGVAKFFEKEARCCLALDACEACPAVAWLPASWRARKLEAINECRTAFALAVRYEDAKGAKRDTGWQTVAPGGRAFLRGGTGAPAVSYGASYAYAYQQLAGGSAPMLPMPSPAQMRSQNIFNELKAWRDDATRIHFKCAER